MSGLLALNAGSSSLKYGLFALEDGGPREVWRGAIGGFAELAGLVEEAEMRADGLAGAVHRVVHGGTRFTRAVAVTDDVLDELQRLAPLAPLHQPANLDGVRALAALRPELVQVATFDTAFHHGHDPVVDRFALPRRFADLGVRRYGFHGLSYTHLADRLRVLSPKLARGRVIAAHLGAGASLCALLKGRSVDTTMGFSALDGLMMATRCGAVDPGVVIFLQRTLGLDPAATEDLLYRQSGLLGVSGLSGDMRVLLESALPSAREAVELFCFRAAREASALAGVLGGLDGLVFTAGIGEHAPPVRAMICERLAWLGVRLDRDANLNGGEGRISAGDSAVEVWIVPADEERVMAAQAVELLRA